MLARQFTGAALSFCSFANASFRRFLIVTTHFHLTEEAFTLHLLLKRAKCLINVIITYNDFNQKNYLLSDSPRMFRGRSTKLAKLTRSVKR